MRSSPPLGAPIARLAFLHAAALPCLAACTPTPPPQAAAVDPRPLHAWLADHHDGLVLDCALPDLAPGARFDVEISGPTSVIDGHLVRVVSGPTGIGLLVEGDTRSFVRWEIALAGQSCTRTPAPRSPVRGRVLDAGRAGVVGARVHGCGIDTTTDEDGSFDAFFYPEPGAWWGLDHVRCAVFAESPDGLRGTRSLLLDEARPESLRLIVTADPPPDPPPSPFSQVPTASDLPEVLADSPAELLAAATQPRAQPPVELIPQLLQEPRGMTRSAYLASDLGAALRPGRTWVFRLWDEGVGTRELRWSVSHVDDAGIHAMVQEFPEDGSEPKPASEQIWTERELRGDSRFPRSATTIEEGTWDLAGTPTPVWIYKSTSLQTGEPTQDRVFAKAPPGLAVHATFHGGDRAPGSLDLVRIEEGAAPTTSSPPTP